MWLKTLTTAAATEKLKFIQIEIGRRNVREHQAPCVTFSNVSHFLFVLLLTFVFAPNKETLPCEIENRLVRNVIVFFRPSLLPVFFFLFIIFHRFLVRSPLLWRDLPIANNHEMTHYIADKSCVFQIHFQQIQSTPTLDELMFTTFPRGKSVTTMCTSHINGNHTNASHSINLVFVEFGIDEFEEEISWQMVTNRSTYVAE